MFKHRYSINAGGERLWIAVVQIEPQIAVSCEKDGAVEGGAMLEGGGMVWTSFFPVGKCRGRPER